MSVAPLLAFNLTVMTFIQNYFMNDRINEVQMQAFVMSTIVANHNFDSIEEPATLSRVNSLVDGNSSDWGVRILVINDRAQVISDSNRHALDSYVGQTIFRPEIISALNRQNTTIFHRDKYVINVAVSVNDIITGRVGAVLLVASVSDIFESVAVIRNTLFFYSSVVAMMVLVLVFITSHRLITPLRAILRVVQRMATGQLDLRIRVVSKDEYAILSESFNNMAAKLEREEKTREEFVSNVSHEIKTPLTAIKVLGDSILSQKEVAKEVYHEFMQDIVEEVDRMTNLTNDLLALVKVDRREQGLNAAHFNLNRLVERIVKRLHPLAKQKQIALLYEAKQQVTLEADEVKLALAISNVIENGIKYTPDGGTVNVKISRDSQNSYIAIKDTGIGIPVDEQDKIFNRFYRVDKTRVRDTGGTGLGLAITHATLLLHNGSIQVKSEQNEGSLFILTIPLSRS